MVTLQVSVYILIMSGLLGSLPQVSTEVSLRMLSNLHGIQTKQIATHFIRMVLTQLLPSQVMEPSYMGIRHYPRSHLHSIELTYVDCLSSWRKLFRWPPSTLY